MSEPPLPPPGESLGLAALARMVFEGADLQPLWRALQARAGAATPDYAAMMDMATLLLLSGDRENGLALQAQAIAGQPIYRRAGPRGGPRLLALTAPGDAMANTPLDFLLEGSDIELLTLYVEAGKPPPSPPEHDVAFLAVGESEANLPILRRLEPVLPSWPRPVLNGRPGRIAGMTRDGVCVLLDGVAEVLAPPTLRLERATLTAGAAGFDYPFILRPVGTHAGAGMARLDAPDDLAAYLETHAAERFYAAPFIDYRGPDGLYRKQRIAVVEGRPFVCHLAVSAHWMVHYMNAAMLESAENRAEEAGFMASFDQDFAVRHARAFASLHERIGLDYFAVDCAELADGRLLLFEADVAMIVHAMDPPDLFPYKPPQMRKVFDAFQAMVRRGAGL